jgi:signal transduction histidine kinase
VKLRKKIILLALAPLILALVALAITVNTQSIELAKEQREIIEPTYLASKKAELRSYLVLARHAIAHLYDSDRTDEAAKAEAKAILTRMDYGDDGYFFVYDLQGILLVSSTSLHGVARAAALSDMSSESHPAESLLSSSPTSCRCQNGDGCFALASISKMWSMC